MVFNEVDMLELRVNELHEVVDHFVVVESEECFGTRKKKPLYFKKFLENRPNVTYVALPKLYPEYTDVDSGWQREKYQRNQIWEAVKTVSHDGMDVIICGDVDEIPRPELVLGKPSGLCRFNLDFYYYDVNSLVGHWPWGLTVGTRDDYELVGGVHEARSRNYDDAHIVQNAGWHFSYFGGIDRIKKKVSSFSHSQDDFCQEFLSRDDSEAAKDIAERQDIFRTRGLNQFEYRRSDDPRLPQTFLLNRERYKHFTKGE